MKSPLVGYNTNVRHHGKTFHIQTEDSGTGHGHIFTHLFADGGRIVATKKTTYAQWIGTDRYPVVVKKLMQAQHKAMFIALRDGLFDTDEAAGAREFAAREIVLEDPTAITVTVEAPVDEPRPVSAPIDVAALERAAAAISVRVPAMSTPQPMPRAQSAPVLPAASPSRARLDPTPVAAISTSPRAPSPPPPAPSNPQRYQQTQPVESRPRVPKQSESLFGADILSEKSLDEVIMSYLAEDLDEKE